MTDASVQETAPAAATVAPVPAASAPVSAAVSAPAQSAAAVEAAPQVAPSSSEAAVAEPAVSPAVEVTAAALDASSDAPAADTDILGGEGEVKADEVPAEKAEKAEKPAEEKPAETVKTDAPAELPTYELTVPEGITLPDDVKGEFTKILGDMEIGKLDHAGIQAKGDELIALGTKMVTDSLERMKDHFVALHEQQKSTWLQEFKADKELGGARTNTTINTVRDAINTYGGTPEQVAAFRDTMKSTGVTNNPAVIRLISNMANTISKFTTEQDVGAKNTRMVAGVRPAPTKVKPYQGFYQKQN